MLKIRKMRREDIGAVAALEEVVFEDAWSEQSLISAWEQKQTLLLAAFDDKRLIGYVILYYVLEDGEIARIAVDQEYRRRGVASRMLLEMGSLCQDNGIHKLLLDVRQSNETAIAFYEERGFCRDGVRRNYYTNPTEDAILMSCMIGS